MKRSAIFGLFMLLSAATVHAADEGKTITINASNFYIGGGLGFNTLAGGSGQGFQLLGGYEFDFTLNGDILTAVELGYMDTGNFDATTFSPDSSGRVSSKASGFWLSVVETVPVSKNIDALVRLGFDFGDDNGLMIGAGGAYNFNRHFALRTEYVVRDAVNSFQFNLLYSF
jgi:hypothetical protein